MIRAQGKDYDAAHALLSRRLRGTTTSQKLRRQWAVFSKAHGGIRNWKLIAQKSSVALPTYEEFNLSVTGNRAGAGTVFMHLVPEGKTWRIDALKIRP
jgi:hypothetical protein